MFTVVSWGAIFGGSAPRNGQRSAVFLLISSTERCYFKDVLCRTLWIPDGSKQINFQNSAPATSRDKVTVLKHPLHCDAFKQEII